MSGPTKIDPRTAAPADGVAWPIAEKAELGWICSFCGLLRVFEGGRPLGLGQRNGCRECGGRLAIMPGDRAAIAECAARRNSVGASTGSELF